MITPRCSACGRDWPTGTVPGCPCLDDDTVPANEPDCPICHHRWPGLASCSRCGPAWVTCQAPEPPEPVFYELAPLGCLGAVSLLGGWVVVWALWQGVRGVLRLAGVWP